MRFDLKISRIVGPTATALLLFGIMAVPAQAHAPGVHLTGLGAAEINGVLSPGEWNNAGTIGLDVNLPGGGTTPGTLFVMNDDSNLYLAVRFARPTADPQNYLSFYFDNDNDGLTENGDDFFALNPQYGLVDAFHVRNITEWGEMFAIPLDTTPEAPPSQSWPDGIPPAGTIDGQAAFANDGEFSIYEMSHPLDSGDDAHDFSLKPGDTVGFLIFLNVGFAPPTIFPANGWGDILISSPVLPVEIDIKPGSSANSINVRDQGLLPVAVLSDVAFDAHDIDPRTVRLGGVGLATRGPASTLKLAYSYEDINDDGDLDLVVFFRVQDLVAANALTTSTTQLTLTANTYSGIPLEGSDSVSVVPAP